MNLRVTRFIDKNIGIPICKILTGLEKLKKIVTGSTKSNKEVQKILLMKFWGFGNILLLTPALKAIRRRYPDAEITFLSLSENSNLLKSLPVINKVLEIKAKRVHQFLIDAIKLVSYIKNQKYDLVVDFEQFARSSSIITYLSGAKERVGFNTEGQNRQGVYTKIVKYNNDQHIVKTFFDLVRVLRCKTPDKYELMAPVFSKNDEKFVNKLLQDKNINLIVAMHPGTGPNATVRRWPLENYAKLSDYLIEKHKSCIIYTGSKSEKNMIEDIINRMKNKNKVLNFAGILNFPQLSYLMTRIKLFISSDTGPLHLAASLKVKTISFFGPNTPKIYGQWGKNHVVLYKHLKCSPCITNFNTKLVNCDKPYCILNITAGEVINKIDDILKKEKEYKIPEKIGA